MVRPWKPPRKEMMFGLPVACRASRILASIASVPALAKKKLSISPGAISPSFSASSHQMNDYLGRDA